MSTVSLTLDEIFELAKKTLLANGCDDETASILSDLIRNQIIIVKIWNTNLACRKLQLKHHNTSCKKSFRFIPSFFKCG